jgi:hypothetical protein
VLKRSDRYQCCQVLSAIKALPGFKVSLDDGHR